MTPHLARMIACVGCLGSLLASAPVGAAPPPSEAAASIPAGPTANAPASLRRFALVIGSNNGGSVRERLRYAGQDARRIADVLRQLGGVAPVDLSLLSEPDLRDVERAFDAMSERVRVERRHGQRVELVVYYSGHADEAGILVGGARYDYGKLRKRIRDVPADVHIAIVDSCASGSFTRVKGGAKMPPFLRDSSNQVSGFAFLSSSSADEDAQESDRIGASFFTYYFVAGLRGAADRNRDGKITLTEAYQFAYEQTLGRTQNTVHGPQHAAYDMHLSGTGDVVITDLRATEATLVLPVALRGRITIVDASGRVVVELSKDAGEPLSLALPDATYTVRVDSGTGELIATVTLPRGGELALEAGALRRARPEETVARGDRPHRRRHRSDDRDDDRGDDRGDDRDGGDGRGDHRRDPWYRGLHASFGGGLRLERPTTPAGFDALVTLGGTSHEIHGRPLVGVAETGSLAIGLTLGDKVGFAYDVDIGFGPGVFLGQNLQVGATIGVGLSGITGGVLEFAWKVPTELFAILELSRELRPVAYVRQNYLFGAASRKQGSSHAKWGDEAEVGAGLKFGGRLQGFVYGSLREAAGVRYWGIGVGAVL